MSGNSEVIVIFPIFGQFGVIRTPDSRHIVCKTYNSIESNLLFYKKMKTELKNLESSFRTTALRKALFLPKKLIFGQTCWHKQN